MADDVRLRHDVERVDRLRWAVEACDDHSVFVEEICPDVWDYANRVLPKMIATCEVFATRTRLGQPDFLQRPDHIDYDVAEDLAADTINAAIKRFEKHVLGKWDGRQENPAMLGTYFVGFCSMVFANEYRRWRRDNQKLEYYGIDVDETMKPSNAWDQPEAVIYHIEFERHIELIQDPFEQQIARLDDAGLTDRRIADVLNISDKVVEYRLKKTRLAGRARWASERAMDDFRGDVSATA